MPVGRKGVALFCVTAVVGVLTSVGVLSAFPPRDAVVSELTDRAVCGEWTMGTTSALSKVAVVKCDGNSVAVVMTELVRGGPNSLFRGQGVTTVFVNGEEQPQMTDAEVEDLLDAGGYGVKFPDLT